MRVQLLDHLGHPVNLPATRVLILTDAGTPLALAVELAPGMVDIVRAVKLIPGVLDIARAGDADFNNRLAIHGIDRTVQVDTIAAPKMGDFPAIRI